MRSKYFLLRSAQRNVNSMDFRARSSSAGYSVHSSNAMMMSRTQSNLRFHGAFGAEEMPGTIEMGTERHAFFVHFAQFIEAENLEASGIGEDGPRPRHKAMQSAQFADLLDPGAKVEVIGIAEDNLYAEFFEDVLRDALDRGQRTHRHEDWVSISPWAVVSRPARAEPERIQFERG